MRPTPWYFWIKVASMLVALVGIIYSMSYFRSGKAFQDPNSVTNALIIGSPAPAKAPQDQRK
jgi:hypothetical protein